MTSQINQFDATASMLGYLYQARYALYLSLKKIREVSDPDECYVSIEKFDDIAFETGGNPVDVLQTKYHGSEGNLTDRSTDLWKTIRVWANAIVNNTVNLSAISLTLITTQSAPDSGVAASLMPNSKRDIGAIKAMLDSIAKEKTNKSNQPAYAAYDALLDWQKEQLISSINILCRSESIIDLSDLMKKELRTTIEKKHEEAFLARLEGQWFKRFIIAMSSECNKDISLGELRGIIDDLRSQFALTNLTADYTEAEPEEIDIDGDERNFVAQLRLIGLTNPLIRNAIINYYRASEQRSRWSRDGLVKPGELKSYLKKLEEEWEIHYHIMSSDDDHSNPEQSKKTGKDVYTKCQSDGAIPIRREFNHPYVARGSYHTLADEMKIGWHPNYQAMLSAARKKDAT